MNGISRTRARSLLRSCSVMQLEAEPRSYRNHIFPALARKYPGDFPAMFRKQMIFQIYRT